MVRLGDRMPAYILEKLARVCEPHFASIRAAHQHGCCVAAGTDAGTPGNPHGNIGVELAALRELDLSAEACWHSATSQGALALGVDDRGILEPGRRADLIAVGNEAFDEVHEQFRPHLVMRGGQVLRSSL